MVTGGDNMVNDKRKSGIDVVGDIPFGTHLCMFYVSSKDLAEVLVPYFKTGLENNEFCIWVCWEPLLRKKAIAEISREVGDLEAYISKGQIEIVDYSKQYTAQGKTGFDEMIEFWIDKERLASERGFEGLRLAGNTYWLEREEWQDFMRYEAKVDEVIRSHRMLAICPYSLDKCNAADALDVMSSHRFALIRREGKWDVIQSLEEQRLRMAVASQMQNFRNSLDDSPLGVRIVTAEGELLYANKAILDIYGYSSFEELKSTPTKRRYTPDSYAEHRERARKRKQGEFVPSSYEISMVRKDGEVRQLQVFRKEVVWNGEKQFQAIYQDITERKRAEETLRESEERFRIASQIASDVVYERDLQTGIATFYGDIDSHLGYEPGGYPRTMEGWREHVHPEDLAWIDRQSLDKLEPGVQHSIEYRMRKKDGTYMTWWDRIMVITDEKKAGLQNSLGLQPTSPSASERRRSMGQSLQRRLTASGSVVLRADSSKSMARIVT
jgi:PAS domain S-box-containing protein